MSASQPSRARPSETVTADISNEILAIYRRVFGHRPERTSTFVQPQFAVCVLREIFTPAERALIAGGRGDKVGATRSALNDAIEDQYVAIVASRTGRPVQSHLARVTVSGDVAVHFFLFED